MIDDSRRYLMTSRCTTALAMGAALMLLTAPGCVPKKKFKTHVDEVDTRITSVEGAVEVNERGITDLKQNTDKRLAATEGQVRQAQQRGDQAYGIAEEAAEAAKGKLVWDVMLTDDDVKFEFGKAKLTPNATSVLDKLVQQVKSEGRALYIEIEGHTDSVGQEAWNVMLGEKRAAAVRSYLNENGLPLHAMNTISYGESRPIADNATGDGRSKNRRVVIRVLE
jgi:outer membrane protein OmpA-like peptidoglycan-associated protein